MAGPAPLFSLAEAPAPAGGAAEWVAGAGGVRLRAALFPAPRARGTVVLSPGRGEPIEKYYEVVEELRGRGFAVLAHDWRGQGLSARLAPDPLRGHASGWRSYLDDLRAVLNAFEARAPRPWLALGHSMGGGLTALAVAEGERRFAGLILTAPMLGLNLDGRPASLVRALAWAFSRTPGAGAYAAGAGEPLPGAFDGNRLTHDRARWDRTRALLEAFPALRLGGVTWGWLELAFVLAARLEPARVATPLTIVAAGEEELVDNAAARRFAGRASGARYVEIEGARHEILMETDERRAVFWREFDRFVDQIETPSRSLRESPSP